MASVIITEDISYCGKESNELIFEPLFADPQLTDIFRVMDNVQSKQKIYMAPTLEKIVHKYEGCGTTSTGQGISLSSKNMEVEGMEVLLDFCADQFDQTVFEGLKKTGIKRNDITGTDIEGWIRKIVMEGIQRDIIRLALLDDANSGVPGYGIIDGLWTKIFDGVADYDITHYKNSLGSSALAACDSKTILRDMIENQSDELLEVDDSEKLFISPYSIWKNWKNCLQDSYYSDLAWQFNQKNQGNAPLGFDDITLRPVRMMDRWIKNDLSNANPYRTLLTVKDNIILGTDTLSDTNQVDIWYDKMTDKVWIRARFKLGVQYAFGKMITAAY